MFAVFTGLEREPLNILLNEVSIWATLGKLRLPAFGDQGILALWLEELQALRG